ncbi:MAG: hypothetical protein LUE29_08850 [Lachnospiraceae bacterium]|nr:hypothetical protein [Lachnospiraceae bacterium]
MKKQERETGIFSDEEFDRVEKLYQAITNIDSDLIERAQNPGIERVQDVTIDQKHDTPFERVQKTTKGRVQETTAENIPYRMKLHKKVIMRLNEMMKQAKDALAEAIEDAEIEGRTVVTALVCVCVIFIAGAFIGSYFGGTSGSALNEGEETSEADREREEITDGSDESEEITEESGEDEGVINSEN